MDKPNIEKNSNTNEKKNHTGAYIGIAVTIVVFVAVAAAAIIVGLNHEETRPDYYYCPDHQPHCMSVDKPMIYLYPSEDDTEVSVRLSDPDKLTVSYPKYNEGWKVLAQKDGSLVDLNTNRNLYGLYWEGENYPAELNKEGFVVKGEEVADFLEDKLAELGLNERESEEFIVYWLPKLQANKYNYIRFDLNETIDDYMQLNVSPKPDTMVRVVMVFKGLDAPIDVTEVTIAALLGIDYLVKQRVDEIRRDNSSSGNTVVNDGSNETMIKTIKMRIGDKEYTVKMADNEAAQEFAYSTPFELPMIELNGNEKYYQGQDLLKEDKYKPKKINAGDLMLYGNDTIVLFYQTFDTEYEYTRLGWVQDAGDLAETLGSGNVDISFTKN